MQGSQTIKSHAIHKNNSVWFKTKLISQFLTLSFLISQPFYLPYLHAAPVGGNVVGGTGSISQSDATTTINQTSQNLAVDWQSFDVNTNERVQFVQPNSSSIALNRIVGNNGSTIQGQINANGQVILVNPNGIFFTPTATINVGGLIASSLDMTPADFMNGNYIFNEVLGTDGAVINSGVINASVGGNVALIGKQVKNEGLISANLGSVILAAGKQSVLTFDNQGLIGLKVTKEVLQEEVGLDEAIINSGDINASGGRILLTASTSQDVFSQAVNNGTLDAATSVVVHEDGSFTLGSGADVLNTGSIDVSSELYSQNTTSQNSARIIILGENVTSSGSIKANSIYGNAGEIEIHSKDKTLLVENSVISAVALSTGNGGLIKILGDKVGLFNNALVNASGVNGGGEVLIGGDRQGLNTSIRNANFIYLGENTTVKADATDSGNGGKIIAFANDTAQIHASLYARGGLTSGNGGFIETSGLNGFSITQAPELSASNGNGGLWLIDPYNITIVNTADCAALCNLSSPFTSSALNSYIDVDLIRQALITSDVSITTGNAPATTAESGDISFQGDLLFAMPGSTTRTLTLDASRNITFTTTSSISRSSSNDALNLVLNAGGDISLSTDATGINTYDGSLNVTSGSSFNSGGAILNLGTGTLDLDAISATGNVILGNISAANLSVLDVNAISQQASTSLTISNTTDLSTNAATNSIILTNANDFNLLKLQGAVADITDSNDINLADGTSLTTSLKVTAGRDIDDNGAITISNAAGTAVSTFDAGRDILINGNNDNFNILNINNARNVDITDSTGGISISANNGTGSGGITGSFDLVASGNGNIIDSGEVNVLGDATFTVQDTQSIILDNVNNTFGGTVDFSSQGSGSPKINNLTFYDTSVLALSSIDITGNLNVTGLTVEFDDTVVVGSLTAESTSSSTTINTIYQANGTSITNDTNTAIFTSNGHLLLDENNNFNNLRVVKSQDATIVDDGGISFSANSGTNQGGVGGDLNLTVTNGDITSNGEVNAGTASFTVDDTRSISLNNSANTFAGIVDFNADSGRIADITFTDDTVLTLPNIDITGNLDVTADSIVFRSTNVDGTLLATTSNLTTGDITQTSGVLDILGISTFDATRDVNLAFDNNFRDTVAVVKARNVTFADITGIRLGKITTTGNLSVTSDSNTSGSSTQDITQLFTTGNAIVVAGTTTLTANDHDISLTNTENNFDSTNTGTSAGALSIVSADEADITDANSLVFGNVTIDRNSPITSTFISGAGGAGGNITQVAGTTFKNDRNSGTVTQFNTNGGTLTLTNVTNDISVLDILNTTNASITDRDRISLRNVATTGNLTIDAGNSQTSVSTYISDAPNATISVGGVLNTTSKAGTANGDVSLNSTNNNFNIVNIISARNVDIVDNTDAVTIQGDVLGDLKLTANGTSTSNVITNSGALTVSGSAVFLANANQSIYLSNASNRFDSDPIFTANSGRLNNITITDTTALEIQDGLNIRGDLVANASTIRLQDTTVDGNLDLTAITAIDQRGGKFVNITGTSTLNGTTVDFSNTGTGNNFQSGVVVTNSSSVVNLVDETGGISLGTATTGFTSASLNVVSTGGNITQNNSIVTGAATFDSGNNDTLLHANANNDFTGGVTITNANNARITDTNILRVTDSNTSGNLDVTSGGALSFGVDGNSLISTGGNFIFSAGGTVTQAANSTITVSGNSQMLARSGTTNYNIILNSLNNDFTSVDIQNGLNVSLRDNNTSIDIGGTVSGNLTVQADDTLGSGNIITNTTALRVTGSSQFITNVDQSIDLSNANNVFTGNVNFSNPLKNLNLTNTTALTLQNGLNISNDLTVNAQSLRFNGTTTVGGNLIAVTTTGVLNQNQTTGITVTGTSTLNGGEGGINLRGINNFNGAVSLQTTSFDVITNPSNVRINDINDILLGSSNIQGGLTVTATNIAQVDEIGNDGITVANVAAFVAISGSDIILDNPDNNFNVVSFSASSGRLQNVAISNVGDLNLSSISVTNNLTAISGGDITNSGVLSVDNLLTVDANNITLGNISNNFTNVTVIAANDANITDQNSINFVGDSSVQNNLTINAGQNITDSTGSSVVVSSGITRLNSGSGQRNTIVLDSTNHNFNEVRVNSGGNATISDINGFDLGTSNVGENLYLVADSDNSQGISNITNNGGALRIQGFTNITTSSSSDVTLNNSNNNFSGYLTFNETSATPLGSISISNTNLTTLKNINATDLSVTSSGSSPKNIQQTATSNLSVSNNTILSSVSADILLNNASNDFSTLNVTSANDVTITDVNAITLGSINATGTVIINSKGISLGDISANAITLDSGSSTITDNNDTATNITSSGTVTLTASGGIGSNDPLELEVNGPLASLSATNTSSGNIEFINSGRILLDTIKNSAVGGTFELKNTNGNVTIKSLIIDKSNVNSISTFDVSDGDVLGVQGQSTPHVTANTAIFNMNNTGSVGRLGEPLITDVPNKIEVISATGSYIQFYGQVPPSDFIGDNAYRNRALQAIESLSGQQLIEIESLAEIDPAIFTDVRNYNHSDIALMMPSDQRYTDDEEEDEEAKQKRQKFLNSTP